MAGGLIGCASPEGEVSESAFKSVAAELGLESEDPDSVIARLEEIRNETHPDRTGGDFDNEEQRKEYFRVTDLLLELTRDRRTPGGKSLAPVNLARDLAAEAAERHLREIATREQSDIGRIEAQAVETISKAVERPFVRAKVSLWSIGALALLIPQLQGQLDKFAANIGVAWPDRVSFPLAVAGAVLAVAGIWVHLVEQKHAANAKALLTDRGTRAFLALWHRDLSRLGLYSESLSVADLAQGIRQFTRAGDDAAAEAMAQAMISKLLVRGLLKESDRRSISASFVATEELLRDVTGHEAEGLALYQAFGWFPRIVPIRRKAPNRSELSARSPD